MSSNKSPYIGLWLLLSLALVGFLCYSFAEGDLTIGNWHAKKAPFKEMLTAIESQDSTSVVDSLELANKIEQLARKPVETDTCPKSILLIGDSMTLNLAYRLSKYAKQNGHTFHAVNWDSSNTRIWSASDTLTHFIKEYEATFVFISLGSNELYLKNPESRRPDVKKILAMVGDLPYVWIGPPNWKEDFGINDMIASECRPGSFFRSAGIELKRKKDHVHPTRDASALWMDSLMRWMPKSAHPILAELPSDSLGKVSPNVVFLKALNK